MKLLKKPSAIPLTISALRELAVIVKTDSAAIKIDTDKIERNRRHYFIFRPDARNRRIRNPRDSEVLTDPKRKRYWDANGSEIRF